MGSKPRRRIAVTGGGTAGHILPALDFLDAYRTLWDVSTKDGIGKFGKLYKSVAYFATVHNDAGANSICDEFHAGTGFLNNHI